MHVGRNWLANVVWVAIGGAVSFANCGTSGSARAQAVQIEEATPDVRILAAPAESQKFIRIENVAFTPDEFLDSIPALQMADTDSWLHYPDSRIGLMSYRSSAELEDTGEPVPLPPAALPAAAMLGALVGALSLRRRSVPDPFVR